MLHKAVLAGNKDIVLLLLKNGANPEIECEKHKGNPIDLAKQLGRENLARIMKEKDLSGSTYTEYQGGNSSDKKPFRRHGLHKNNE